MSAEDDEIAKRFDAAVDAAFDTGDREGVYAMFADDVEYTTPHRTLRGLTEVREELKWGTSEKDSLDVEVEDGDWQDLGGGSTSGPARDRSRASNGTRSRSSFRDLASWS